MEMGMKRISNDVSLRGGIGNQKWQKCRFLVKGNSMMPLLRNGKDEVVVGPCDKEELKLFDVILFRKQTGMYCIGLFKRGSRYLMQGDGVCRFYEECKP